MADILLNLYNSTSATGNWNNTSSTASTGQKIADMIDDTGASTGIALFCDAVANGKRNTGVNAVGSGDASWVDQAIISAQGLYASTNTVVYRYTGLTGSSYDLEVFSSVDSAGGSTILECTIDNFSTIVEVESNNNSSAVAKLLSTAPTSNEITLKMRKKSGAANDPNICAIRLTEATPSSFTLSNPTATATGATTATVTVDTDTAQGNMYYYISQNSTETAGTIETSGPSEAVISTGTQTFYVEGLSESTGYYAHFYQKDGATVSNVVSSTQFTTSAPVFTIDSAPTTINADGSFDVVVSNPATVPTTLNSTIKLTDASGQAATINSVTGSDPYTINATFPRATTDAQFGAYALYVEVDAENATSGGTASYVPASGWSYVDVGTIDTSSEIYTQYSAGTIATGWQAVIKSPTNEDSVTVTMTDDLNYTFGPYVGSTDQTTEFYAINASQTVLAEETITFDFSTVGVPVLSSPTGTATGAATASGTVTTDDGTGTLYFYASTNSTEIAATIKASGSSQAVGVSGSQGVGVTGLTPETLYYLHYVQDDDGAQESNVVSSSSFTTLATSDVPATSRTSIFQIANYLRSLGTYNSSQCNELVVEWLVSEGITRTQINQMLYGYLGGLGYTGSFNDRLKAWSEDV